MEMLIAMMEETPLKPESEHRGMSNYQNLSQALELVFSSHELVPFDEAVKISGLNRTHFAKYFKEFMGMSFAKFALRYRLGCAAADLISSNLEIKEIAAKWGFTDSSHFYRCFEKNYQVTPAIYRKQKRISPESG